MSATQNKYIMKQFSRNCAHCNYKVILLGDYGVGKTTLFRRIKTGRRAQRMDSRSSGYDDTIDCCTKSFKLENGKVVQVSIKQ